MNIKLFILFVALFCTLSAASSKSAEEEMLLLTLNCANEYKLPRNFRTTTSLEGTPLMASASGQFSVNGLRKILSTLQKENLWLVDLREESHGFADGAAVSWRSMRNWANRGKSLPEIAADERKCLLSLLSSTHNCNFQLVMTEEELAKREDLNYFRLPITDHCPPTDQQVDRFLLFYRQLNSESWVHYHCSAGKGRASMLMVMHDIMKNGDRFSFEEILLRQGSLGGKNYSLPLSPETWKLPYHIKRLQFLRSFYDFRSDALSEELLWTEWIAIDKKS